MPKTLTSLLNTASKYWWLTALFFGAFTARVHFFQSDPAWDKSYNVIDIEIFSPAAKSLLLGDLNNVYADPRNQGGVLHLLTVGLVDKVAEVFSLGTAWAAWSVVLCSLFLIAAGLLADRISKAWASNHRPGLASLFTVLLLITTDTVYRIYQYGHWGHLFVGVLVWAAAGNVIKQPSPRGAFVAGILCGIATGFEPAAIMVAGIVVLISRWRERLIFLLGGAAAVLLIWLPFVLQPNFAMSEFKWDGNGYTLWRLIGISDFNYTIRILQAALAFTIVATCCVFIKRRGWDKETSSALVVLTVALARCITDVMFTPYYFLIPLIVIAAFFGNMLIRRDLRLLALIVFSWFPLWLSMSSATIPNSSLWPLMAMVSTLTVLSLRSVYIVDGRILKTP